MYEKVGISQSFHPAIFEEERERYEGVVCVPLSKGLFHEQMNEVATTRL